MTEQDTILQLIKKLSEMELNIVFIITEYKEILSDKDIEKLKKARRIIGRLWEKYFEKIS